MFKTHVEDETSGVVNKETNKGKEHNKDEKNGLKKVQSAPKYEDMNPARIEKTSVACLHFHKLGHTTTQCWRNQTKYYQQEM